MHEASVHTRSVAFVCLVVLAARSARSDDAPFRIKTPKADDRVVTQLSGDRVVFAVLSPSGIGEATITRQGERWPRVIVLRLRLSGMERLRIDDKKMTLSALVTSSGGHRTSLSLTEEGKQEVPIDRSSPYWMEIRVLDAQDRPAGDIPLKDGVFEVTLPKALLASNPPTITLDWIDFYR